MMQAKGSVLEMLSPPAKPAAAKRSRSEGSKGESDFGAALKGQMAGADKEPAISRTPRGGAANNAEPAENSKGGSEKGCNMQRFKDSAEAGGSVASAGNETTGDPDEEQVLAEAAAARSGVTPLQDAAPAPEASDEMMRALAPPADGGKELPPPLPENAAALSPEADELASVLIPDNPQADIQAGMVASRKYAIPSSGEGAATELSTASSEAVDAPPPAAMPKRFWPVVADAVEGRPQEAVTRTLQIQGDSPQDAGESSIESLVLATAKGSRGILTDAGQSSAEDTGAAGETLPATHKRMEGLEMALSRLMGQGTDSEGQMTGRERATDTLLRAMGMSHGPSSTEQSFQVMPSSVSAGLSTAPAAPQSAAAALAIDVPLRQPNWGEAFAERVVWLAKQGLQQAEIQLHPREMGPIEVQVSVHKDQAQVTFVAHQALTRDALEAALPRLREMLQDNGLNLAQSEVSQHSFGQSRHSPEGSADGRQGDGGGRNQGETVTTREETDVTEIRAMGLVDYYA